MITLGRCLLMVGIWLFGALAVIFPASGFAFPHGSQDLTEMSLEDLMNIPVMGASKYAQKLSEAPADVSIVTQEDIKKYGYRTLADILRSVRGFYVTYDRNYSYLGVRGFNRPGDYNMRILFLVDGHRLNDGIYDCVLIGTDFPVDVDLIDRVEIIRGPSYALYGSGAFLAVINVITRQGRDLKGVELSGEAGSLSTFKGRATYGNRWRNGLEVLASGTYYDSQGNKRLYYQAFDAPVTNYGIAANRDRDSYYSFFGKAFFKDFTLTGVYHSREKLIPTGSWGTVFNDSRNKTLDARAFLDLKYEHTFSPSDWKLQARLYYDRYFYDGDYLYNFAGFGPARFILNKDVGRGEWWGGEVQVTKRLFDKHPIVAGAEVRHYFRQDQKNYNDDPYHRFLDDQRSAWVGAGYAQGEFVLPKNFRLTAGVRYDYYSTFGATLNPRFALVYTPWEKTALKLLYGHGFRAPNVYEFYWKSPGVSKGNPSLRPERIKSLELVWRQQLTNSLNLTTAAFYYRINDLITQMTDPGDGLLVYKNFEQVASKGLEVELAGRLGKFLDGRLSYTLQEVKNLQTGQLLTNSPKHLVKANLSAPLYKDKLFGGLEVLYTSPRLTLSGRRVSGFTVTNFTLLSRNVFKHWEFSASVYNLFNQKYGDPGGEEHLMNNIRQDGIGFRVKALFRF